MYLSFSVVWNQFKSSSLNDDFRNVHPKFPYEINPDFTSIFLLVASVVPVYPGMGGWVFKK